MQIASSPRDRTSGDKQEDLSDPAIEEWLQDMGTSTCEAVKRISPGTAWVCDKLIGLCYERKVDDETRSLAGAAKHEKARQSCSEQADIFQLIVALIAGVANQPLRLCRRFQLPREVAPI